VTGVIDNDVLLKGTCYSLLDELSAFTAGDGRPVGVLGSARYVVSGAIRRRRTAQPAEHLLSILDRFLQKAAALEPDDREARLAAELELAAQLNGYQLDTGESQLCAVCATRGMARLLTGDKRAVIAMEQLLAIDQRIDGIRGTVRCLEQAILSIAGQVAYADLRNKVCRERDADMALSICFSCWSEETTPDAIIAGLTSYIDALRREAINVLGAS
jgi:hypothetical protein